MPPLYRKYRPKSFDEIIGNDTTVEALESILDREKDLPHAFLFHGPSGCGKTTLARLVAKKLGVSKHDLAEIDSADYRGIDTVRNSIRKQVRLAPMGGACRIWIMDECHQLTKDAQSALLKLLEDTPLHVYFILCTTNPKKLLPTIINRCTAFEVEKLNDKEISKLVVKVVAKEDVDMSLDTISDIAEMADGSARVALVMLDTIIDLPENKMRAALKNISFDDSEVIELCREIMKGASGGKWPTITKIIKGLQEKDVESIRRAVRGYCRAVLMKENNPKAAIILQYFNEPFLNNDDTDLLSACHGAWYGE